MTSPTAPSRGRILYVDDDEAIVFLIRRRLERMGYGVSAHTDAQAALRELQDPAQVFSLAITDHNMPGMSGLELARAIKALRPTLPLAITSGYVSDELREQARQAGVDEVLLKGDSIDDMFGIIERLAQTPGQVGLSGATD